MKLIFLTFFIVLETLLIKNYFLYIGPFKTYKNYKKSLNDLKKFSLDKESQKIFDEISKFGLILLFKLIVLSLPYILLFSILNDFKIDNIYKIIIASIPYLKLLKK